MRTVGVMFGVIPEALLQRSTVYVMQVSEC